MKKTGAKEYAVDLKKGQTVVLTSGGAAVDMTIAPVKAEGITNYWGVH